MSVNIDWNEIIKKEARGINDFDLGEVQEIQSDVVVTPKRCIRQRQILSAEKRVRPV